MKKCAVLFSLLGLFLASCTGNHDHIVVTQDNPNDIVSFDETDYQYKVEIEYTCYARSEINVETYFDIKDKTEKILNSETEYNEFLEKIKSSRNLSMAHFDGGSHIDEVDFNKGKVIVYPLIHDRCASYYDGEGFYAKNYTLTIKVKETIEDENSRYVSVGFVFISAPSNKATRVVVNVEQSRTEVTEKKPIIYFYPEEEMDLSVKIANDDRLLTSYPKYDDGWNIHLNEDGTFTTNDSDREYYALYFEARSNYDCTFEEGFYVNKDNALNFLEEKMNYIGFTNREVNEFMMYWLPILENNVHSLVYFELTEERNEECQLIFSTEPDTLIRTIVHIKKVDGEVSIPEQQLKHYDRNGFVVTEWGGVEY